MTDTLTLVQNLEAHDGRIWGLSWHYTGKLLATCSADKSIKIWLQSNDSDTWQCECLLSGEFSRTVRSVAWSPCGNYLAAASFDATVCIWKKISNAPLTFARLTTLEGHSNEVKCVAWSASGRYLATSGRDKSVWIWQCDEEEDFQCSSVLQNHTQDVKCVEWHPSEDILVSGSYDNTLLVYTESHDDWEVATKLTGHQSTVWRARFHPDGRLLASTSDDATVRLWIPKTMSSLSNWICVATLQDLHSMSIYDCAWTVMVGRSFLATASADNSVCVLEVVLPGESLLVGDHMASVQEPLKHSLIVANHPVHREEVNCLSWRWSRVSSPSGDNTCQIRNLLITGSDDGNLRLWNFQPTEM